MLAVFALASGCANHGIQSKADLVSLANQMAELLSTAGLPGLTGPTRQTRFALRSTAVACHKGTLTLTVGELPATYLVTFNRCANQENGFTGTTTVSVSSGTCGDVQICTPATALTLDGQLSIDGEFVTELQFATFTVAFAAASSSGPAANNAVTELLSGAMVSGPSGPPSSRRTWTFSDEAWSWNGSVAAPLDHR